MSNRHGTPIWYELFATSGEDAGAFYGKVVGWRVEQSATPGVDYRMLMTGDRGTGGILQLTDDMTAAGARPAWFGYIGVDDVDAAAEKVKALGGEVHVPPTDIPGVGRFAFCVDPQGVMFYVMRGSSDQNSQAYDRGLVGACGWNELYAADPAAAFDFYGQMFGWEKVGEMDMGPMGTYDFIGHAGDQIGAIMRNPPQSPMPHWNYYFRVESIDAARAVVEAEGGTIAMGPHQVPTGDYVIGGFDPQGANFCLVGGK
ncbi:VOC family protein [Sphingomonas sp.]|uniref:VOC family protein n=1 Tax=Sphingomonas sp. TaxID=28214 RepID=UPI001AFFAAD2|nr:VOC family protein [Sphingomonas sp.]MBO9713345.1 VOC family protein [Sphingomonas sp.]